MKSMMKWILLCGLTTLVCGCGGGNKSTGSDGETGTTEGDEDARYAVPSGCEQALPTTRYASFYEAAQCLFTGPDAVQFDVAPDAISPERVVVLRGQVLDQKGEGAEGVEVRVAGAPDLGKTLTRPGGYYDIAANGGGQLRLHFEKNGFVDASRHQPTQWRRFHNIDALVLVEQNEPLDPLILSESDSLALRRGPVSSDADGERAHAVVFRPGTQAFAITADGEREPIDEVALRVTELTVGDAGSASMPAELPPTSAFTYAVELDVVQAEELGATSVEFDTPVINYVDNFIGFPAGIPVPVGYYNEEKDQWEAYDSGLVIDILDPDGGLALVDADGDGEPDADEALQELGIDEEERELLAREYGAGASLWRVELPHFSKIDLNWGGEPPGDAVPSGGGPMTPGGSGSSGGSGSDGDSGTSGTSGDSGSDGSSGTDGGSGDDGGSDTSDGSGDSGGSGDDGGSGTSGGDGGSGEAGDGNAADGPPDSCGSEESDWSTINCDNQTLGETLPIVGTPYSLNYQSGRMAGRRDGYVLDVRLSTEEVPESLERIELEIEILGQLEKLSFDPEANLTYRWVWDGKDGWGRSWRGWHPGEVRIGFVYKWVYEQTERFAVPTSVEAITGNNAREELTLWRSWPVQLGGANFEGQGLAGWTLDIHHSYDRTGRVLYHGTGSWRSAHRIGRFIETVAGTGVEGFAGDGTSALEAELADPHGFVVAPDGTAYISDELNHRIRRILPAGTIETFAGTGETEPLGDGGPALEAAVANPLGLALRPNGALIVAERGSRLVREIAPDGTIATIAGGGDAAIDAEGVPALEARFMEPHGLALGADGTLYVGDASSNLVRKIAPDGLVTTVAGGGTGDIVDGMLATDANLRSPTGIALDQTGKLYVACFNSDIVVSVDTSGILRIVAGTGTAGFAGDGGPGNQAQLLEPHDVQVSPEGIVYITDEGNRRVRVVDLSGRIDTIAGTGEAAVPDDNGDGGSALDAHFRAPRVGFLHQDGSFWVADILAQRVRRIAAPFPGYAAESSWIASSDGRRAFEFDTNGQHLQTIDAMTGVQLHRFEYDDDGRLVTVADTFDNRTQIQWDNGELLGVEGPYGALTTLAVNDDGLLAAVSNPAGETTELRYQEGGLLTELVDPGDPEREVHSFEYDAFGRLTRDANPKGKVATLRADREVTRQVVTFEHNGARAQTFERRFGGRPADDLRIIRDAAGFEKRVSATPSSTSVETLINSWTTQSKADPRFGAQASYSVLRSYRPNAMLEKVTETLREVTLQENDPLKVREYTSTETINGAAWVTHYDAATRTETVTSPEGRVTTTERNQQGQPSLLRLPSGAESSYEYDERGRLTQFVTPAGRWTYDYGDNGPVSRITNPLGKVVEYEYDLAQRPTSVTVEGVKLALGYDKNGSLTDVTPPGQPTHASEYAPGQLLASYLPPGGEDEEFQTRYAYNEYADLASVTDPTGDSVETSYDAAGRVKQMTHSMDTVVYDYATGTNQVASITSDLAAIHYSYSGALLSRIDVSGATTSFIEFVKDSNLHTSAITLANSTTEFEYDLDGLLTSAGPLSFDRDADSALIVASELQEVADERSYDSEGQLTTYAASAIDSLYQRSDTRDALGRIIGRDELIQGEMAHFDFTYDNQGRLTTVSKDGTTQEEYRYDDNGNRLEATTEAGNVTAEYDVQDRLLSYGSTNFEHTPAGDLSKKTDSEGSTEYVYDRRGSLRHVTLPDGTEIDYIMDGLDRRIGKQVDGELSYGLLYKDQLNPVAQLGPDGQTIVASFIYGSSNYVPDVMYKDSVYYRYLTDQVGSVRLVVNASTGEIAQRIDYDAFGVVLSDTNPGFQPFGFAGGIYDADTGLVRFGARDYDAMVGRWTSKDPIGWYGGQANLYVYVDNNPVNESDPTGLMIYRCTRIAELTNNQERDKANGFRHAWLWNSETGSEAGMGPRPGGWDGIFGVLKEASLNDHRGAHNEVSWKDVVCEPQPFADEVCVEGYINESNLGQSLGNWFPFVNDCGSYADDVLLECGGGNWFNSGPFTGYYPYYLYY